MKMNKSLAGCGVIFGVIGTLCAAIQHDLGYTLVGLGATGINLMTLLGVFDEEN